MEIVAAIVALGLAAAALVVGHVLDDTLNRRDRLNRLDPAFDGDDAQVTDDP